jgi:hypothetical protein
MHLVENYRLVQVIQPFQALGLLRVPVVLPTQIMQFAAEFIYAVRIAIRKKSYCCHEEHLTTRL